jgi:hypothetical protein
VLRACCGYGPGVKRMLWLRPRASHGAQSGAYPAARKSRLAGRSNPHGSSECVARTTARLRGSDVRRATCVVQPGDTEMLSAGHEADQGGYGGQDPTQAAGEALPSTSVAADPSR